LFAVMGLTVVKSPWSKPQEHAETQNRNIWAKLLILIWIIVVLLVAFMTLDYFLYLMGFTVLGIACGKAATVIFKNRLDTLKGNKFLTLAFVIIIITSQLLVLTTGCIPKSPGGTVAVGWDKLGATGGIREYKPNGSFEASFENTVGSTIKITNLTAEEEVYSLNCTSVKVKGIIPTDTNPLSLNPDEGFIVTAVCGNPDSKIEHDTYQVRINITYYTIEGGVNVKHRESGYIQGAVRA